MKKFLLFLTTIASLVFLAQSFSHAAPQEKEVKIKTKFPAPVAAHDNLKVNPKDQNKDKDCKPGELYTKPNGKVAYCKKVGDDGGWAPLYGLWELSDVVVDQYGIPSGGNEIYPFSMETNPDIKIGIGTTTPEFRLTLDDDGGILAKGILGSGGDYMPASKIRSR